MTLGILLDVCIVALFVYGYSKGFKRGIITMAVPLVSFAVGTIGLKLFGSLIYAIFGDSLEEITRNFLLKNIADTQIITIIFQQMINDALIKKIVQIICFMFTYVIASSTACYVLKKLRLSINNTFLNSLDKNIGGVFGVLSSLISVMLVLAVFNILITANDESVFNTMVTTSYIGKILYRFNPLTALLG